jgi:hypothetical protein
MSSVSTHQDSEDKEKLYNNRVNAARAAVMANARRASNNPAGKPARLTRERASKGSQQTLEIKNQASTFIRKMMKDSWIAQTDGQLLADTVPALEGGCVYLPGFICGPKDFSTLKALTGDLQHCLDARREEEGGRMVHWSQHLKFENPDFSHTFNGVLDQLDHYFDVEILATRLNFYRDGSDFKPFHHDSHAYGSNGKKEDFTVGVSFGSTRELSFRHEVSGQTFSFPQTNGDVFAFDSDVNRAFTHGVPKLKGRSEKVGPRFSIIAWGRRRTLNASNSAVTARRRVEGDPGRDTGDSRAGRVLAQGIQGERAASKCARKMGGEEKAGQGEETPIGMEEVARMVEEMVLREEEKEARRAPPLSQDEGRAARRTARGTAGKGEGRGGDEGGDAAGQQTSIGSDGKGELSATKSASQTGRRPRRGGRVQHSWAA